MWFVQRQGYSGQTVGGARILGSGLFAAPYWVSRTGPDRSGTHGPWNYYSPVASKPRIGMV